MKETDGGDRCTDSDNEYGMRLQIGFHIPRMSAKRKRNVTVCGLDGLGISLGICQYQPRFGATSTREHRVSRAP